jgi:hypothetical protein
MWGHRIDPLVSTSTANALLELQIGYPHCLPLAEKKATMKNGYYNIIHILIFILK